MNIIKNRTKLFALIIMSIVIFYSCSQDDSKSDDLKLSLDKISKNLTLSNLKKIKFTDKIINTEYFNQIKELKKNEGSLSRVSSKIENDSLLPETEIILKDYFNALQNDKQIGSILITQYYLNEIENLNIIEPVKNQCIEKLIFIMDVMLYLDYDSNSLENGINGKTWTCAHRDCFDCCMYKKAYAVFEQGNWLDMAQFISNAPANTAWWVGQCSWDCW